jgi:hypothetical protein
MSEHASVATRFNGPPTLGQGGYSCGLVTERIDADVATVSLRAPVPLETPMEVRRSSDGGVALVTPDGTVIAEGAATDLVLDPPPALPIEEARAAAARSPLAQDPSRHAYPTCFGCGPYRDPREALRIMPGPVVEGDFARLAGTWTPCEDLAAADGAVSRLFTWAALDCPTGWAAASPGESPHVLARLTARLLVAPIHVGIEHVVVAWLIAREGRKARGNAAIYTPDGELCALAEGLWIRLRDPSSHGAVTAGA